MVSERTPAQQRWDQAITKRDFLADAAFQRAEEVGRDVAAMKERVGRIEAWMPSISSGIVHVHERIDALAAQVERHLLYNRDITDAHDSRLTALEQRAAERPPEREPGERRREDMTDPCTCGHPENYHHTTCRGNRKGSMMGCRCTGFTPTEPVADGGEAVDPVLFHICAAYRAWYEETPLRDLVIGSHLVNAFKKKQGTSSDFDIVKSMLAYGVRS